MSFISTNRASYQHVGTINRDRRPIAVVKGNADLFADIALEATRIQTATTDAAYILRLTRIRKLLKEAASV